MNRWYCGENHNDGDDTILFFGCTENLEVRLCRYLLIFSILSGLRVNLHKSYLIGARIDMAEIQDIASELGCEVGYLPMRCLGLQLGGR